MFLPNADIIEVVQTGVALFVALFNARGLYIACVDAVYQSRKLEPVAPDERFWAVVRIRQEVTGLILSLIFVSGGVATLFMEPGGATEPLRQQAILTRVLLMAGSLANFIHTSWNLWDRRTFDVTDWSRYNDAEPR